jgi:hypothetical protein
MSEQNKTYKSCQSCGIPFDKDPQHGGTEADGTKSNKYCGYCYKDGQFVQPNWTAADMQAYATKKLQQYGIPEMIASLLTKGIPKLERWTESK